ncbi:MFS-type transporter SLC18B1-like isoform X2 [Acanthaster planci]|uniref:MFS-type transporter SLC18B1-like isoform X2 n=1 Tax=Acanthaster planci TaxID=133434 RepID=A0A8B7Z785_ACAPL|nr:MFS-type transporter SLC18B1-like isoform X2 [Acanthaster planci]
MCDAFGFFHQENDRQFVNCQPCNNIMEQHKEDKDDDDTRQEYANTGPDFPPIEALPTSSTNWEGPDRLSDSSNNKNEDKPERTKYTFHQKATFAGASLAALANMMAFAIISVFYPIEAKARGVSQTVIGLVFGAFAFSAAIGSPIWGKIIPTVGAKFVFLAGAFVTGGCNVLFGFIVDMPTEATFTGFSVVIRLLEGLGTSATITSSAAIMAVTFPDNVGTAVSLIEMMGGLSYAVGPAIGGLLYNAGGFKLPFFTLGGFVLVADAVNFFLMPQQGSTNQETGSLIQVLRIPAIWIILLTIVVISVCMASFDPILSIHLKELDFTVIQISLVFLSFGLVYALSSVFWGAVADAKKATRIMIVMGLWGTTVFFLLVGPSPLLKIPPTKLIPIIEIPFGSAVIALVAMPTLVDMFTSAEWYGIPNNLGLTSIISGIWNSGFAFGTMAGPIIAGALTEQFGFPITTTILAGCCLVVMLVVCLFGVWEYQCGKGRRIHRSRLELESDSTEHERSSLIPNNL